ncbi:MAG: amidohydrolase family protein [Ilumatobacteraceae bacterium]
MLTNDMQLISVDDHIIEPPHLWQSRLPDKFKEAGPRIIETADDFFDPVRRMTIPAGSECWQYEGRLYANIGLNAVAGRPFEEFQRDPLRFEEMRPGCYDPIERVKDMDIDGVQAELGFPSFSRFAGQVFSESTDKGLGMACIMAYNDFVIDEWSATAPARFIPMVIVPFWDPQLAANEIERTANKGAKAIAFSEDPSKLGFPSFYSESWAPLFHKAEEYDLPLCLHFGSSSTRPQASPESPTAVNITLAGLTSIISMADLLFSPLFIRHPDIKIALSEGGIGWMPHILEKAEHTFERHRWHSPIPSELHPTEIFRKHIFGCFIYDDHGLRSRHEIGIDNIMWEGDYPHSDSDFPHARKRAAETFADIPDEDVHKIVELNARRLYNFTGGRNPGDSVAPTTGVDA